MNIQVISDCIVRSNLKSVLYTISFLIGSIFSYGQNSSVNNGYDFTELLRHTTDSASNARTKHIESEMKFRNSEFEVVIMEPDFNNSMNVIDSLFWKSGNYNIRFFYPNQIKDTIVQEVKVMHSRDFFDGVTSRGNNEIQVFLNLTKIQQNSILFFDLFGEIAPSKEELLWMILVHELVHVGGGDEMIAHALQFQCVPLTIVGLYPFIFDYSRIDNYGIVFSSLKASFIKTIFDFGLRDKLNNTKNILTNFPIECNSQFDREDRFLNTKKEFPEIFEPLFINEMIRYYTLLAQYDKYQARNSYSK